MRYVALLRAINTPPRHVKMARLRDIFTALGFDNVATVIASGNVVFDAEPGQIVTDVESALDNALGFSVPTYLFTVEEFAAIVAAQPFDEAEGPIEVSVLPEEPAAALARTAEAAATGPDRVVVEGRAVYWLRAGSRAESTHSEARVARMLGMTTTRRSLSTMRRVLRAARGDSPAP